MVSALLTLTGAAAAARGATGGTPQFAPHAMLSRSSASSASRLLLLTRAFSPPSSPKATPHLSRLHFSSRSPYPLYYDLITHSPAPRRPRPSRSARIDAANPPPPDGEPPNPQDVGAERKKRKYYKKLARRMYGSDSDAEGARGREEETVELRPEVVEFPTLHKREEELYFYDAFAFPWEKDKHYRMVYQLEKKYFPDHCLDKAFVDLEPHAAAEERKWMGGDMRDDGDRDERALMFFEEEGGGRGTEGVVGSAASERVSNVPGKKVEEFFNHLKKVPIDGGAGNHCVPASVEPFLASRKTGLPPRWDGPTGTVVLVNKPKGWTSFTVCGKLRRLVKVQKVGHAGTLDPMATGLLIVCVGKATKLMERYQGMIKGYSGIFRLGEATSTWDADSPVIQREPWEHIKDEEIRKAARSFCGEIWQVPPMFSAIKVGGERMYEKARKGEMVELAPRRISILQFEIERSLDDRQNQIFRVTCSKGTYIRSLCADFGKALGSCAHLTALRRDSIGQYLADEAWDFQELQEHITKSYL